MKGGSVDAARLELTEALVAAGNEDRVAFRRVYCLTSSKLFGICLRICGDKQIAEDVLQEVYLTIRRRAGAYDPGRSSPVVLTLLAALALAPLQALHMATHKLALGQPTPIVWLLMIFDALWIGLFAALVGSALFVGVRTGLTWRGWTISPSDLGQSRER